MDTTGFLPDRHHGRSAMNLFNELKRRNVFRVIAAYAVVAWLLIQVGDVAADSLAFPGWFMPMLFVVLGLGFPVALVLSWAYELTPEGVKRTEGVDLQASVTPKTGGGIDRLILVGLLAVIAVMAVERVWFAGAGVDSMADAAHESVTATSLAETTGEFPPDATAVAEQHSIAVLPFTNMSPDPDQEYFADGITEDILTRLAGIGDLRVISRTSIMRYKGSDLSLPQIASELGVSHVLEGSVRRAGNQVRITGQLIRAADDAHLWAESFDRELSDIFAVQSEIAGQIAQALQLQLSDPERERLQQAGTDNPEAYEEYLLGRAQLNRSYSDLTEISTLLDEAEHRFRAALDLDPDYADAWAGLARVALWRLSVGRAGQAEVDYQTAVEAAGRAIRLAPESAAGHVWLGHAYRARGQGVAAAEQYRLAAGIEPDSVDVLRAQADSLAKQGRLVEAIRMLQKAIAIDPGDPTLHDDLGYFARDLGALSQARDWYQAAWGRIMPHEARLNCELADIALREGDDAATRRRVARMQELESESPFQATCSLNIYLAMHDLEAAHRAFDTQREYFEQRLPIPAALVLAHTEPDAPLQSLLARAEQQLREDMPRASGVGLAYGLARVERLRGDHEAALKHLDDAVGLGWRRYRGLDLDITWDPLRDDPRFQALVRRVDDDLARQRAELAGGGGQP